jgi:hypothetical protein
MIGLLTKYSTPNQMEQEVLEDRKLRWEDGVDQDMRILGVKNWKKFTLNRDEWAKLLKKAMAHQGLSSQ